MEKYSTNFMGLKLKNPLIVSACSMTSDIEKVKKMEEFGASAIVLPSLFEEELTYDKDYIETFTTQSQGFSPEAFNFFPETTPFSNLEGEDYLENLKKIKKAVSIPVIGSLNTLSICKKLVPMQLN